MTRFQALFIKYLRIRCDGTWRWIDAKYSDRYNHNLPFNLKMTFGGNQMTGMMYCDVAMKLLNEQPEDGWN